jgi:vacuolar iron transporter family protein
LLPFLRDAGSGHLVKIQGGQAVLIIALFNDYISVAKNEPFSERFLEMATLSLGVALFSFTLGYIIRTVLGVEV